MTNRERSDSWVETALAELGVHDADSPRVERIRARCLSELARRGRRAGLNIPGTLGNGWVNRSRAERATLT